MKDVHLSATAVTVKPFYRAKTKILIADLAYLLNSFTSLKETVLFCSEDKMLSTLPGALQVINYTGLLNSNNSFSGFASEMVSD